MQIKTMTRFTWHQSEETASKESPSIPVRESREKTEVSCSRWKHKLVKITMKTRERVPVRLKTQLPYDRAIPHLAVYLEKTTQQKGTSSPVFNLAPFSFFFFFESSSIVSDCLRPHGLHRPWNSPGQNTGVHRLSFLQQIFLTQELNPGLLHCRKILYHLSHQRNPKQDEHPPRLCSLSLF